MEDVKIEDDRELHWRMVFGGNYLGMDNKKTLLHANMWDVYVNKTEKLIKGEYLAEVVSSDRKKILW